MFSRFFPLYNLSLSVFTFLLNSIKFDNKHFSLTTKSFFIPQRGLYLAPELIFYLFDLLALLVDQFIPPLLFKHGQ